MPSGVGKSKQTRFGARMSTVQNALKKVMDAMGAVKYEWTIENGVGVRIMFVLRSGDMQREYHYISDYFNNMNDNLRAAQKSITDIWRVHEDYRIRTSESESMIETLLAGFRALPHEQTLLKALPDPEKRQAWEILGVDRHASKTDVRDAFNRMAKDHHPDKGGNPDEFIRIKQARDDMYAILD